MIKLKNLLSQRFLAIFLFLVWVVIVGGSYFLTAREEIEKVPFQGVVTKFSTSPKPIPEDKMDPGVKSAYSLKSNDSFSGLYLLGNIFPEPRNYLLLTLINYQQAPFFLEDKKDLRHLLNLSPKEKKYFPFKTEPLPEGFYDYLMLLVWEPDNHSLDEEFRMATLGGLYTFQRANLLVGKVKKPPSLQLKAVGKRLENKKGAFQGIAINRSSSPPAKLWQKEKVRGGQTVKYFIHLANPTSEKKTVALFALLDYKQVPIKKGEPMVIYSKLAPKQRIAVEASFVTPQEKGVYELMVFWAFSPFVKLTPFRGKGPKVDDFVEPSNRVAIIVE